MEAAVNETDIGVNRPYGRNAGPSPGRPERKNGAGRWRSCVCGPDLLITPRLGAALTFGLVVAGQLIMAVFLDHYGLLGVQVQSFNWHRLAGIALITAGVVLFRRY
jgi:hypothetical protein